MVLLATSIGPVHLSVKCGEGVEEFVVQVVDLGEAAPVGGLVVFVAEDAVENFLNLVLARLIVGEAGIETPMFAQLICDIPFEAEDG